MLHRLVRVIRGQSLRHPPHHYSPVIVTRCNATSTNVPEPPPTLTNDPVVNKILEAWPGELRNRLNYVCSLVKDNQVYKNEARIRFIDTQEWESYNFKFRRHLMVLTNVYSLMITNSLLTNPSNRCHQWLYLKMILMPLLNSQRR